MQQHDNNNSSLNDLSNYTFSSKNLIFFMKNIEDNNKKEVVKKERVNTYKDKNKNINIFDPSIIHKDSLFWCFYVLLYGMEAYEMLGNQHFVEEKTKKFQYIELLRKKKDLLKIYKIKPLSEIEDELANKDSIGVKTFAALCTVFNLNAMVINKRKYYEIRMTDSKTTIIHQYEQPSKFVMEYKTTEETIDNYRQTFFKLDKLDYKLKSITSYKTEDLIELCNKK